MTTLTAAIAAAVSVRTVFIGGDPALPTGLLVDQPPVTTLPGSAVGAGRALAVGENELAPPPTAFSVGDGALELFDGAVVSAGFSLVVLQALSAPIPTMAAAPAISAICRVNFDAMSFPLFPCPIRARFPVYVYGFSCD